MAVASPLIQCTNNGVVGSGSVARLPNPVVQEPPRLCGMNGVRRAAGGASYRGERRRKTETKASKGGLRQKTEKNKEK